MRRLRVCLVLEGTYPYIVGGVSGWVQELVTFLPEVDFILLTISAEAKQEVRYKMPENVIEIHDILLTAPLQRKRFWNPHKRQMLKSILSFHRGLDKQEDAGLEPFLRSFPPGYAPFRDILKDDRSWELLIDEYHENNPMYSFSEFYWAWRSSYDLVMKILSAKLPKADIYHSVSTGYAGLAASVARSRYGVPFILTEHGLYHKEREMEIRRAEYIRGYQRDLWNKIYYTLSRISYQMANIVISLFEYNRRRQLELGSRPEKTIVIPNGIDIERFTAVTKEKRSGFHVGLVGRVVPIKDIKTFIAMAKVVSEHIPEARFYMIGPTNEDPEYYRDCKNLVKNFKLDGVFEFTGKKNVLDYYSFLDVLLLTSVREAQPLVILEAYCAKVPCVATKVGNIPELLNFDERFLAPSKDPDRLAQGVIYIYEHPVEMEKIIEDNLEKARLFYDRRMVYNRYLELYRSLAEGEN